MLQVDKVVETHCCFCGQQCGIQLKVKDNEVVGFEPWYDFPFNEGKLCPKGVKRYLQGSHPDRLLRPMERDPAAPGGFREVTWDQALDRVVSEIRRIQDTYGDDAFAMLSGVSLTNEKSYLVGKFARLAAGFTFDYTHYLDARYNATAADGSFTLPDGSFIRAEQSKNYLDYIPFGEFQLRPAKGLRIRGRYAFERQKTQHYNRVMTGRDEFASLTPYYFRGYYDYRRHRASLGISWDFRDRLRLSADVEAWVRHFDVYEARDVDNFWTGQLRLDTEIEASMAAAVRVHTIKGKHREHDFFISLVGAHVSRNSNMTHEISLATNFDITRVLLGFEVRGH